MPSYDICHSCGFEFGVSDDDLGHAYTTWRKAWIERGMPWDSIGIRPAPVGWDARAQLQRLRELTGEMPSGEREFPPNADDAMNA